MVDKKAATLLALVLTAVLPALSPAQTEPLELREARERARVMRLGVEAARTREFTLIADPGASRLTLALSGVVLATYRVDRMDLGLVSSEGAPSASELGDLYRCQAPVLHPPAEVRPGEAARPDDSKGTATESAGAAPIRRVPVDCGSSLAIRLISSSSFGLVEGIRDRLRLPGDLPVAVRARIILPQEDAERLFASLPSKFLFLVCRATAARPTVH